MKTFENILFSIQGTSTIDNHFDFQWKDPPPSTPPGLPPFPGARDPGARSILQRRLLKSLVPEALYTYSYVFSTRQKSRNLNIHDFQGWWNFEPLLLISINVHFVQARQSKPLILFFDIYDPRFWKQECNPNVHKSPTWIFEKKQRVQFANSSE